jgi:hypothetical protein
MTDQITITIELPREVANDVGYGWGDNIGKELLAVRDACRKALANPQPETPGLREATITLEEKDDGGWLRFVAPDGGRAMVFLGRIGGPVIQRVIRETVAALSQIPEAKSHDYPLFDLGRALATIERLKSAHHPNSRAVADLDNLAFCLKLAACGEVDSPPPTAPGEASEEVSEGVDGSRGGHDSPAADLADLYNRLEGAILDCSRDGQKAWTLMDTIKFVLRNAPAANPSPIPEDGGWQPIESAPKDGRPVVVWRSPWKAPSLAYSLDDNPRTIADGPHGWFECRTHRPIGVTHWLEVVTPPATPNKETE